MHILYLAENFPFPLTSGYLRDYFFIRELSRYASITLLCPADASHEQIAALAPFTNRVQHFGNGNHGSFGIRWRNRARSLAGKSLFLGDAQRDRSARKMREEINALVQREQFDVVFLSGLQIFPVIDNLELPPVVADICDANLLRIRGNMRYSSLMRLPRLWFYYEQIRQAEHKLVRTARHLIFASCRDRDAVLGDSVTNATVVPNGVNLNYWRRSSPRRSANTIVFTGAMNYGPNTDAALFLIEQIFPLVKRGVADARLFIVGRDPTASLILAGKRDGVTVTGAVDDVRPFLDAATVFVAPLRFGAGIQNKVLEALAMELPVIASPSAAEGLRIENGLAPPVHVALAREEFAEMIVRELRNSLLASEPDPSARMYVAENFNWEESGKKLQQVIASAAQEQQVHQQV